MKITINNRNEIEFVFFFAHPDDEFGAFEKIRRLKKEKKRCLFVYCTKTKKIFQRRKNESLKVLSFLGVTDDETVFFSDIVEIQDGKAYENVKVLFRLISNIIKSLPKLVKVFIPAFEGGHQDHDLLHGIVCIAVQKHQLHCEISVMHLYNNWNCNIIFFKVFNVIERKRKVITKLHISRKNQILYIIFCFMYLSQWRTWVGLLPFASLHYLFVCYEAHVLLDKQNVSHIWSRPHKNLLLYEKRGNCTFEKVQEAFQLIYQ